MGGAGRCCLQVAPGRDWPLRLERPRQSLRCGAQGGGIYSCPGAWARAAGGAAAGRAAGLMSSRLQEAETWEAKQNVTKQQPGHRFPAAKPGGPRPHRQGDLYPLLRGLGLGGGVPSSKCPAPPGPAPRRNALGVKLMRKQRLPSQRPGNPATERPPVSPPTPYPAFRNSSRAHPAPGSRASRGMRRCPAAVW